MPKSFHRTPCLHCYCTCSENSVIQATVSVVFFRVVASISPVHTLAPCALLLLLIQSAARSLGRAQVSVVACLADVGSFCGGRATRGGQREPAPAFCAVQHRPKHPRPLRGHLLASARRSTVAVAWRAQGALCAADGHARRHSVETAEQAKSIQG